MLDVPGQPVAHHLGLQRQPVSVQADAGSPAGTVIGHRDLGPGIERQRILGADRQGVAGPEMDQREERASLVEDQLVAAATGIGPGLRIVQDDCPIALLGGAKPEVEAERLGALELPGNGDRHRVVTAEAERLAPFAGRDLWTFRQ